MASLDVTPYEIRGPISVYGPKVGKKKREITDRQDGYAVFFKVAGTQKPYTIYQTINRVIEWTTGEEGTQSSRATFTEAWKSGRGDVLDKFILPRYYRQSDTGYMDVVAIGWVAPGRRDLRAQGFAPSEDGSEPWGAAMGQHGHMQPPPGTQVLRRWFRVSWTDGYVEDSKDTGSHFYRGRDLVLEVVDKDHYVV